MQRLIGIDTGGTYTDAVLFDEAAGVLAKAKALTTRGDLAQGIGTVLDAVMRQGGAAAADIAMVSVSTTLATNTIVEGRGGPACLIMIGFSPADLQRAGLREALRGDAVVSLDGGHDVFGEALRPLDLAPLEAWLARHGGSVAGFAVAGQFSVANPEHEEAVRRFIAARDPAPVTCSHDLTARLNGPKRALTSLLNARLIGIIHHLIEATEGLLAGRGIAAPLMIVKGDGSLLSVGQALRSPIETILSGPAASIVGARYLTGARDALVSDIGGTTTDIGLLKDGQPRIDPDGARVGGHATFVEAVAMRTFGLGADSEVAFLDGRLTLGPRRVVPVSLLAEGERATVHEALDRQLAAPVPHEQAGRFALRTGRPQPRAGGDAPDREIVETLGPGACPLDRLLTSYRHRAALARLIDAGEVSVAAFSPSDAAHVLGLHTGWDGAAARKAAALMARRRGPGGKPLAETAEAASRAVVDLLLASSAERLLDTALAEDGFELDRPSRHPLLQAALARRAGLAEVTARLTVPVVGLGASAGTYYPEVGRRLATAVIVPDHADVANAIGAVVGRVRVEALVTVSRPDDGTFRVQSAAGAPRDFQTEVEALDHAAHAAETMARGRAEANGAPGAEIRIERETVAATVADREMILEWRFRAVATGRPRF